MALKRGPYENYSTYSVLFPKDYHCRIFGTSKNSYFLFSVHQKLVLLSLSRTSTKYVPLIWYFYYQVEATGYIPIVYMIKVLEEVDNVLHAITNILRMDRVANSTGEVQTENCPIDAFNRS